MHQICKSCACLYHECNGTNETVWTGCTGYHANIKEADTVTVHFFSNGMEDGFMFGYREQYHALTRI